MRPCLFLAPNIILEDPLALIENHHVHGDSLLQLKDTLKMNQGKGLMGAVSRKFPEARSPIFSLSQGVRDRQQIFHVTNV